MNYSHHDMGYDLANFHCNRVSGLGINTLHENEEDLNSIYIIDIDEQVKRIRRNVSFSLFSLK